MPSNSYGFWVASTRNGGPSGRVRPSTVTCRSAIASSKADCVRGVARLISSARITWANTGPGWKTNSPVDWWKTLVPSKSAGSKSGVNWTRWNEHLRLRATALARSVLPTPGTSSRSRCPSARRAMRAARMTSGLPRKTPAMLARRASRRWAGRTGATPGTGVLAVATVIAGVSPGGGGRQSGGIVSPGRPAGSYSVAVRIGGRLVPGELGPLSCGRGPSRFGGVRERF